VEFSVERVLALSRLLVEEVGEQRILVPVPFSASVLAEVLARVFSFVLVPVLVSVPVSVLVDVEVEAPALVRAEEGVAADPQVDEAR
jgi:hypothetical protein